MCSNNRYIYYPIPKMVMSTRKPTKEREKANSCRAKSIQSYIALTLKTCRHRKFSSKNSSTLHIVRNAMMAP